jgi:hypothetical protein
VLLRSGQCRFGCVNLRLRREVFGLRIVQFLLSDQTRPPGSRLPEPFRGSVERAIGRFCPAHFMLGLRNLLLALLDFVHSSLKLGFKLGHFKHGESLALTHDVSDVHVDARHVSAYFWVHIHYLVWLKLASHGKHLSDIPSLGHCDPGG